MLHYKTDLLEFSQLQLQSNPAILFETIKKQIADGWHIMYMLPTSTGGIISYVRSTPPVVQLTVSN